MNDHLEDLDLEKVGETLPIRELLRAFANPPARYAAYVLLQEGETTLQELAEVVTGWTYSASGEIATEEELQEMKTALYHVHLPMLDSLDVVRFDADAKRIRMNDTTEEMEEFIEWTRALDHEGFSDAVL